MNSLRFHVDHDTKEVLLLQRDNRVNGWMPAIDTMRSWQAGHIRLYFPNDTLIPVVISMPGPNRWKLLGDNEEPDVIPDHPWIPANQMIDDIAYKDIPDVDKMYHILSTQSDDYYNPMLERYLRPMMYIDMPLTIPFLFQPQLPPLESAITSLPQHVVEIVLRAAEADKQICPITMEPIQKITGAVTSCGHVFMATAIREWLQTKNSCPECRQPCSV